MEGDISIKEKAFLPFSPTVAHICLFISGLTRDEVYGQPVSLWSTMGFALFLRVLVRNLLE